MLTKKVINVKIEDMSYDFKTESDKEQIAYLQKRVNTLEKDNTSHVNTLVEKDEKIKELEKELISLKDNTKNETFDLASALFDSKDDITQLMNRVARMTSKHDSLLFRHRKEVIQELKNSITLIHSAIDNIRDVLDKGEIECEK